MSFVSRSGPLGVLAVVAVVGLAAVTIDGKGDRVAAQGAAQERLRMRAAPIVAAQIGVAQAEHRRRHGRYAAHVGELRAVQGVRGALLRGHVVVTHDRMDGYVAGSDGFSLTVNDASGSVDATCTVPADHGCDRGRWDVRRLAGVDPRALLP